RSQPVLFPRPAWYHATATWTSPWKKSRSSGSAARHASSSTSCAAKYSPVRMSSRPSASSSDCDLDLSVVDAHLVRAELDGVVELVEAGADVVLPAVPRAAEHGSLQVTVAQRPLQVETVSLGRVELVLDVRERDFLVAGADVRARPRRDVLDARDSYK